MGYEVIVDVTNLKHTNHGFKDLFYESIPCKERIVRCRDCAKSRVERHKGDPERVCWKRKSHGEAVPDEGYCHDGVARREGE